MTRGSLAGVAVLVAAGALAFAGGVILRGHLAPERPAAPEPPAARSQPAVGAEERRVPPALRFLDQDGVRRSLDDYRGHVVVVNFWATWCPPCLHEIPMLAALQRERADRGLQLLGVALDDAENVRRFAREVELSYPTSTDLGGAFDLLRAFGNDTGGLPFTVVIDRSGHIVFRRAGEMLREDVLAVIDPLL